jgi:glutamate-ammonia-ligase adenylyltransferase
MDSIQHVRRCSQYFDILLRNHPEYGEWLLDEQNIKKKFPLTGLYADLQREVEPAASFNDLLRIFRRFKQMHFLRIGARDLLGMADLAESTGQLSDLASVALQIGLETLWANPAWWTWGGESEVWEKVEGQVSLSVLGLGKLGGHELNYVSDIDLILLCSARDSDEDCESRPDLVSRLAHWLSRLIADRFEGDRVFQIDFRLRPYGKDGLLVPSMSGAVEHYLLHGSSWERQMLLKCRPVAGDRPAGYAFMREVRPFVFRRFLDFQAISELREMRNMILTEAARFQPSGRQYDVKLGIGGIREIEFLVQSMQLIYGGRHPELDEPNNLRCLEKLGELGLFPEKTVSELAESYIFLRRVEHCIQLDQNRQTQRLPQSDEARRRLVLAMGFGESEEDFMRALEAHCARVHGNFSDLFLEMPEDRGAAAGAGDEEEKGGLDIFPEAPLAALRQTLKAFPSAAREAVMGAVEALSPSAGGELGGKALIRLDSYFSRASRRPGLVKLIGAAKPWLGPFAGALASSELFAALLTKNPGLVDGIAVGPRELSAAAEWESSASRLLDSSDDYGERLEWIRRLKNERILRIVLADLGGEIDFAELEEQLSAIAGFVIRQTLESVRRNLGLPADLPLSIIGMGKLGSMEMGYLSDLDLVFVYDPRPGEPEGQIPGGVIRLIQRFMNMLSMPLEDGPGYAVDARLRPTGTYGPLVVTRKSWLEYYSAQADIWEIQALLRARPVAGDAGLGGFIEQEARRICFSQRSPEDVWPRICHLRDRMEKERGEESGDQIDLKVGMGGLADIEFIVQGCLLVEGRAHPVPCWRSVRKTLDGFLSAIPAAAGIAEDARTTFGTLRAVVHRLSLFTNAGSGKLDEPGFSALTAMGLWPPRSGGNVRTWEDLQRLRREVRSVFRRFCEA